MPPIQILDPETVAKMAAGEVIQRPFNVAKELIENATDADAPIISLFVSNNCYDLIMVCDTGHGIDRADYPLLCHRFATSKITTFSDIYAVQSFGFRGEALASISYVSRMIVISKVEDQPAYLAAYMDGRLHLNPEVLAAEYTEFFINRLRSTSFTIICVTDLFYAEPIRRNQIRSSKTSLDMQDLLVSIAAANPSKDYSISFISDSHAIQREVQSWLNNTQKIHGILSFITNTIELGTVALQFKPVITRYERILQVLTALINQTKGSGATVSQVHSVVKEGVSSACKELSFYFTAPIDHAQHDKRLINLLLFINGRRVQYPRLKNAIQSVISIYISAFSSIQASILWIVVNPGGCDPNVHPSKERVLLLEEEAIYTAIIDMLTHYMKEHYVKVAAESLMSQPKLKTQPQLTASSNSVHKNRSIVITPDSSPKNTSSPLYKQRHDPSLISVLRFENVQRTPCDREVLKAKTPFPCGPPVQLPPQDEFNIHENTVDCNGELIVIDRERDEDSRGKQHESICINDIDGDYGAMEDDVTVVQQVQEIQQPNISHESIEPLNYVAIFDREFGEYSRQSRRVLASMNIQRLLNSLPVEYNSSALPSISKDTKLTLCGATTTVDSSGNKMLLGFLQSTELALICIDMGRLLIAKMLSCYCNLLSSSYLSRDIFYKASGHILCSKRLAELLGDHMFGISSGKLTLAPHILILLAQSHQNYIEILETIKRWRLFPDEDALKRFLQGFNTAICDTFAREYAELLVDTLMNRIGQYPSDLCQVLQAFSPTLLGDNEWICYVLTEYSAREVLQSFNRIV